MHTSAHYRRKMKNMLVAYSNAQNRWLWPSALFSLTLFALALRWYYVSTALVIGPLSGDATQYYSYAWNLVHHGIFANSHPGAATITPDNHRDPGYPLFLAIWMKLIGTNDSWYAGNSWYAAVLLCQALLGALTVTMAAQLARYWLSLRWAISAGLLIAVWPHSITINSNFLSETLFGFLCTLGLLLCARAHRRQSPWWAITAGLALGAAALTNAILLPFGILLAGFLAWRKLVPRRICVALAIGALLLPSAWAIRNTQIPAGNAGNSSMSRALETFVVGSWPSFYPAWRASIFGDANTKAKAQITLKAVRDETGVLQVTPLDGIPAIVQRLGQHPLRYAAWYLLEKPHLFWDWSIQIGYGDIYVLRTQDSPFQTNAAWIAVAAICHAMNLLLMLLALASLFLAWSKRRFQDIFGEQANRAVVVAVMGLAVFATLVYAILQAEPRYSIPFRSFEILLAVTTLSAITTWWRQRHKQPLDLDLAPTSIPVNLHN